MAWLPSSLSGRVYAALLLLLAVAPFLLLWMKQPFYLDLLSRGLIFAIAVVSLNLILGYGGMVSLGHAAYLGIGAYCVGIPSYYDYYNGWLHLGLALGVGGLFALITGAISLRRSACAPGVFISS
jgi:branched-chain amino acid transport system permease protein